MKLTDRKAYIYALRHPDDQAVYYVGRTFVPYERFKSHLYTSGINDHPRHVWIESLVLQGKQPEMVILETTTAEEMEHTEKKWIAHGLTHGWPLTNASIDYAVMDAPNFTSDYATPVPTTAGYQTIKIHKATRQQLKLLAVRSGETMMDLIERLAQQEGERVGDDTDSNDIRLVRTDNKRDQIHRPERRS